MRKPKKVDAMDIEVAHRVRLQRLQAGMSQTALAKHLGVTFQQVQKYERGINRIGAGRLTQIANAFGVPVSTFFGVGAETAGRDEGSTSSALELMASSGALRLLRAYAQLSEDKMRCSLVELVENIAGGRR